MARPVEMVRWIGDDNDAIRRLVTERMIPRIRDAANAYSVRQFVNVIVGGGTQIQEAERALYWTRGHMIYTPDPPDQELVKWPSALFDEIHRLGHAVGDCDDYVMLFGTLMAARDIPLRLTVAARQPVYDGAGEYQFDHIYTHVRVDDAREWTPVDPSSEAAFGWETDPIYLKESFDAN